MEYVVSTKRRFGWNKKHELSLDDLFEVEEGSFKVNDKSYTFSISCRNRRLTRNILCGEDVLKVIHCDNFNDACVRQGEIYESVATKFVSRLFIDILNPYKEFIYLIRISESMFTSASLVLYLTKDVGIIPSKFVDLGVSVEYNNGYKLCFRFPDYNEKICSMIHSLLYDRLESKISGFVRLESSYGYTNFVSSNNAVSLKWIKSNVCTKTYPYYKDFFSFIYTIEPMGNMPKRDITIKVVALVVEGESREYSNGYYFIKRNNISNIPYTEIEYDEGVPAACIIWSDYRRIIEFYDENANLVSDALYSNYISHTDIKKQYEIYIELVSAGIGVTFGLGCSKDFFINHIKFRNNRFYVDTEYHSSLNSIYASIAGYSDDLLWKEIKKQLDKDDYTAWKLIQEVGE